MNSSKHSSCSDIIATRAWQDTDNADEPDYGYGWQIEHLWINDDGKYSTCDSDGSHEPFDGRGVRGYYRDASESWKEYAAFVAETGEDPLGSYSVDHETRTVETWTATLETWIGSRKLGLRIKSVRRKGDKTETPNQSLPDHVRDYLEMKRKGGIFYCEGIHSFDDICATGSDKLTGRGATRKITFTLTVKTPIDPEKVRAALIAVATLHLTEEASK
jgi:hypothetical protein